MLLYYQIKLLWKKKIEVLSWVSLLRCFTSLYFTFLLSSRQLHTAPCLVPKAWMPGRPLSLLKMGSKSKSPSMSCWECRGHTEKCCLCSYASQDPRMELNWKSSPELTSGLGKYWKTACILIQISNIFFLCFGIYFLHFLHIWRLAKPVIIMLNIVKHFF